jgi:hypothetical protein
MKKRDVVLGQVYAVKVSGAVVAVRLVAESPHGGWVGRNERTGREIRIRSAAKLRYPVGKKAKMGIVTRGDAMIARHFQNQTAAECNPFSDLPFAAEAEFQRQLTEAGVPF